MIAITGATGRLGRLAIEELLRKGSEPSSLAALVRNVDKASDLASRGIAVRHADYDDPSTLALAFGGVGKLLFIASNAVGRREPQHRAVIEAAKAAGVGLVAYTSLLHATTSPLGLRAEHVLTERLLDESGVPHVLLRNGWYTENYTSALADAVKSGEIVGASGEGRISAATRADYAAAAAAVLRSSEDQSGRVHELAGDSGFTLAELAQEVSRQSGRSVVYRNVSEDEYKAVLVGKGMPEGVAGRLAATGIRIGEGALFDDSHQLSQLIGRPTTPLKDAVATALAGLPSG